MRMNASTIKISILDYMEYQRMNFVNELDLTEEEFYNMNKEDLEIVRNKIELQRNKIDKILAIKNNEQN